MWTPRMNTDASIRPMPFAVKRGSADIETSTSIRSGITNFGRLGLSTATLGFGPSGIEGELQFNRILRSAEAMQEIESPCPQN